MTRPDRPAHSPPTLAVYGGFFLTGVVSVLLGPLIPELTAVRGVGYAETGNLFVAQFAASSVGALLSSFHLGRSLVGGYALMAAGLALLTTGGWSWAWVAMALVGLGLGLTIAASNLWTARVFSARRGAALSLLNLVWGVGAVVCPLLFAALAGRASIPIITASLAASAALVAMLSALTRVGAAVPAEASPAETPEAGNPPEPAGPPLAILLLLAAILFLYVGAENSVGGWLVAFADRLDDGSAALSLLIGSGFWGALLAGRLIAPWLLRRLPESRLYAASLGLAVTGTAVLAAAGSRSGIAVGALLTGLGMAALFPLTVSLLAAYTEKSGSRTTGWVFAFCGLGGAALPWLTGRMADAGGAGRAFWVPLAALGVLAVLYGRVKRSPPSGC